MSSFIIIAGPQAAGKTTIISRLKAERLKSLSESKSDKPLFALQESRQIIVHKNLIVGGVFMEKKDEEEVVACDLSRMDKILAKNGRPVVYLDECNIFTVAHAKAHGCREVEKFAAQYLERLAELGAAIIFLDISPAMSWRRREASYRERLVYFYPKQHDVIMERFREYLSELYDHLWRLYYDIPFPKVAIDASGNRDRVYAKVKREVTRFSE
ncbi:hypothetical protein KGQ31_01260 [Patescibacteria group bacterium]|nr:hypothetical protein [Patescibacteria group bacterium]